MLGPLSASLASTCYHPGLARLVIRAGLAGTVIRVVRLFPAVVLVAVQAVPLEPVACATNVKICFCCGAPVRRRVLLFSCIWPVSGAPGERGSAPTKPSCAQATKCFRGWPPGRSPGSRMSQLQRMMQKHRTESRAALASIRHMLHQQRLQLNRRQVTQQRVLHLISTISASPSAGPGTPPSEASAEPDGSPPGLSVGFFGARRIVPSTDVLAER